MGVGRGYHTREVETLRRAHARQQGEPGAVRGADGGAPQGLQRGVLLPPRQALPRSRRPCAYRGYTLAGGHPRAAPASTGRWRSGSRSPAARRCPYIAQRGIKGMVTLNGEKIFDQVARAYQAEAAKAGRHARARRGPLLGRGPLPGRHRRRRRSARVEPYHDERYKWFAPFGFVRYADERGPLVGHAGRARAHAEHPRRRGAEGVAVRAALARDRAGSATFEARYPGLDQMMIHWAEGMPPKEFKEQLALVRPRGDAGLHRR